MKETEVIETAEVVEVEEVETNETKATPATKTVASDYKLTNVVITDIKQERETGRLVITLNTTFKSIDFKLGTEIETNTFSIDRLALCQQLIPICDELEEADYYTAGEALPFLVLKPVLKKAIVSIDRIYKRKGELRENKKEGDKDSLYTQNLYKSVFTAIKCNMSDVAKKVMAKQMELLSTREERIVETKETIIRPPFGF